MRKYVENLYIVWGFHGILVVDTGSHTDAQWDYCDHYQCDVTMIEHCIRAPDPDDWAMLRVEPTAPPHVCGYESDDDDSCEVCDSIDHANMDPIEVDAQDARLEGIDLESIKAAVAAQLDQINAHMREAHGPKDHFTNEDSRRLT